MRILKRIAIIIGALILTLFATVLTALKSIDLNSYKAPLQKHITELLGRTLTIAGEIELDIAFESHLVIRGLQLLNAYARLLLRHYGAWLIYSS